VQATERRVNKLDSRAFEIRAEFAPQAGDIVVKKQRASAFYGTPLVSHLNKLGVRSLIVCGESTSGCVRASVVDAYSNGYHTVVAEECTYDRHLLSHKISLFDLHHKYADVMHLHEVVENLK
jgi:nicotinamidase-related amidase